MADKKKMKCIWIGYGIFVSIIVGILLLITLLKGEGKTMEVLRGTPMMVVDVVILGALLGDVLVQCMVAEDYHLCSAFRVERHKFYCKRKRLLHICQTISISIAVAFKLLVVIGTGQFEELSMGMIILYGIVIGVLYAGVVNGIMLMFEMFPVVPLVIITFTLPFVLFFLTVMNIQVPVVGPSNLCVSGIYAVAVSLASIYLAKIHKTHFETIDC